MKRGLQYTSPAGVAKWCWLTKPNYKWDADGEFSVTLVLDKEDAAPFIETIEEQLDDLVSDLKNEGKKKVKEAPRPYQDEEDDEGNPTGAIQFKFKSKAKAKPRIPMYDSQGTPMEDIDVWAGSKLKVSSWLNPYVAPIGAGISMRLRAVQVLDLVSGGANGIEGFGFETEEEGYVRRDADVSESTVSETSKDDDEMDSEEDF